MSYLNIGFDTYLQRSINNYTSERNVRVPADEVTVYAYLCMDSVEIKASGCLKGNREEWWYEVEEDSIRIEVTSEYGFQRKVNFQNIKPSNKARVLKALEEALKNS